MRGTLTMPLECGIIYIVQQKLAVSTEVLYRFPFRIAYSEGMRFL